MCGAETDGATDGGGRQGATKRPQIQLTIVIAHCQPPFLVYPCTSIGCMQSAICSLARTHSLFGPSF